MEMMLGQIDTTPVSPYKMKSTYGYSDSPSLLMMGPKEFSQWIEKNNSDVRKMKQGE